MATGLVDFGSAKASELLEEWRWLVPAGCELFAVTLLGDAFLESEGAVTLLDANRGELRPLNMTRLEFESAVASGREPTCLDALRTSAGLTSRGFHVQAGCCFSYAFPLVVGGADDLENIEVTDLRIHFSVLGQLHRETRNLGPGERIAGFVS